MSDGDGMDSSSQARVGSCGYVLSCQALNIAASQGHGSSGTYPVLENTAAIFHYVQPRHCQSASFYTGGDGIFSSSEKKGMTLLRSKLCFLVSKPNLVVVEP
jgi:hypothetical protein